MFKKDISKITWLYSFKPSTLNIPVYQTEIREYLEVAVLLVEVEEKNIERIQQFINRCIPYPLVILFHFENEEADCLSFAVMHKRTNQSDNENGYLKKVSFHLG